METIPTTWLWISGAFFAVAIIMNLVLVGVLIKVTGSVREVKDKVGGLVDSLRETSGKLASLAQQLEQTTASVREKSEKVLVSASAAVDTISGKAGLIATILGTLMAIGRARAAKKKAKG